MVRFLALLLLLGALPAEARSLRRVLDAARSAVGQPAREADCSGFVRRVYANAGVDLFAAARPGDNGVRAIRRTLQRQGRVLRTRAPRAGDVVFFDNSYDRDHDGKRDDRLTHVGIVDSVGHDGTAQVIHASNHGVVREPMNLRRPHQERDAQGRRINAPLRRAPRGEPRLLSELYAGVGRLSPSSRSARAARDTPRAASRAHAPSLP